MSTTVSEAFVRQYERRAHEEFQNKGFKFKPTIRVSEGVVGRTTTFQKIGQGTATTKARHGTITPMNQDHTAVECPLEDFYAGDWVDRLDEAKTNINERDVIARGGAMALGRKIDDQVTTILDTKSTDIVTWDFTNKNTVENALLEMTEALYSNDVDNDGEVYGALTSKAWAAALKVESFVRADYVGADGQSLRTGPAMGPRFKDWNGVKWMLHTRLPGKGTTTARVFIWHKSAIGYGVGAHAGNVCGRESVAADITWHGDRAAHFVNHMMSGGACMIDDKGVIKGTLNDTAALPTS